VCTSPAEWIIVDGQKGKTVPVPPLPFEEEDEAPKKFKVAAWLPSLMVVDDCGKQFGPEAYDEIERVESMDDDDDQIVWSLCGAMEDAPLILVVVCGEQTELK